MEIEIDRGTWLDPRTGPVPLAEWAEEFLSLARRLSPSTQETYRRNLEKYILPRFGAYRLGRLPSGEIENWLNDEVAAGVAPSSAHRHYRTLRRVLQVAVEKRQIAANPCDHVQPPHVPRREMAFLAWEQVQGRTACGQPVLRMSLGQTGNPQPEVNLERATAPPTGLRPHPSEDVDDFEIRRNLLRHFGDDFAVTSAPVSLDAEDRHPVVRCALDQS